MRRRVDRLCHQLPSKTGILSSVQAFLRCVVCLRRVARMHGKLCEKLIFVHVYAIVSQSARATLLATGRTGVTYSLLFLRFPLGSRRRCRVTT